MVRHPCPGPLGPLVLLWSRLVVPLVALSVQPAMGFMLHRVRAALRNGAIERRVFDSSARARALEEILRGVETDLLLGLATSRRIVEEHSGGVEVSSPAGRGTTVTACLPPADGGRRAGLDGRPEVQAPESRPSAEEPGR